MDALAAIFWYYLPACLDSCEHADLSLFPVFLWGHHAARQLPVRSRTAGIILPRPLMMIQTEMEEPA